MTICVPGVTGHRARAVCRVRLRPGRVLTPHEITATVWKRPIDRGGELGVLRVREHPLNVEVHPLTAKSTPSK